MRPERLHTNEYQPRKLTEESKCTRHCLLSEVGDRMVLMGSVMGDFAILHWTHNARLPGRPNFRTMQSPFHNDYKKRFLSTNSHSRAPIDTLKRLSGPSIIFSGTFRESSACH